MCPVGGVQQVISQDAADVSVSFSTPEPSAGCRLRCRKPLVFSLDSWPCTPKDTVRQGTAITAQHQQSLSYWLSGHHDFQADTRHDAEWLPGCW